MKTSIELFHKLHLILPLIMIWMMIFWINKTPMIIMIFLILFSFLISLNIAKFSYSSLYAFLMFLMMTSGILILFTFFISMISNEWIFNKPFILMIMMMFIMTYMLMKNENLNFNYNLNYQNIEYKMNLYYNFNINNMYKFPFIYMIIMLMIYLILNLYYITKICSNMNKPMRSMFNYE